MSVEIRHFVKGEYLPQDLRTDFESGAMCDEQWIWVAVRGNIPVAILVAAPAHIVAIVLRLVACGNAESTDVRSLLVTFVAEIKKRGYLGYLTWLDPTKERELALMKIIRMANGFQMNAPQVVCGGLV